MLPSKRTSRRRPASPDSIRQPVSSRPVGIIDTLRARLGGTVTIPAGVDITEPTGEVWDAETQ